MDNLARLEEISRSLDGMSELFYRLSGQSEITSGESNMFDNFGQETRAMSKELKKIVEDLMAHQEAV